MIDVTPNQLEAALKRWAEVRQSEADIALLTLEARQSELDEANKNQRWWHRWLFGKYDDPGIFILHIRHKEARNCYSKAKHEYGKVVLLCHIARTTGQMVWLSTDLQYLVPYLEAE